MVMVNDFSRYTQVSFFREKSEAFDELKNLCIKLQTGKELTIKRICSDHGGEFENRKFVNFYNECGIKHEGIFLGYSSRRKAYRVFNKRTSNMEEFINVISNDQSMTQTNKEEENPQSEPKPIENETSHDSGSESEGTNDEDVRRPKEKRLIKGHSSKDIIGDSDKGVKTRRQLENLISHVCFTSKVERRKVKKSSK